MKLEEIIEIYSDLELLKVDDFDEAVVGIEVRSGKLVYNIDKMVEILMEDDMTEEDAIEYLDYNVIGAYVGELTPIYIKM
jgi:hypothetical protein